MKEIEEKTMKEVYANIVKAILIIFYFLIVNLAYEKLEINIVNRGIQFGTMIILAIAIIFFEKGYKNDDDKKAIEGIEILVLAITTLTIDHIVTKYKIELGIYNSTISYIFSIYFILKGIVIYTKGRKKYADSLSDIKEIVQKNEPSKKEATKKETKKKEDNKIEQNKTNTSTEENKKVKRSTTKKTTNKKTDKEPEKKPTTTKKSTKKISTTKKVTKKTQENKVKEGK